MTTNRKKNNVAQNDTAEWATWISVILAIVMLVVNLFRIGEDNGQFETLAYIVIGIAASLQIIFYLKFDQEDADKKMNRDFVQDRRKIVRENRKAQNVITETESRLKIIRYIGGELKRLNLEFSDLPVAQREHLLEKARQELLSQYAKGDDDVEKATSQFSDLNGDGQIGDSIPVDTTPFVRR